MAVPQWEQRQLAQDARNVGQTFAGAFQRSYGQTQGFLQNRQLMQEEYALRAKQQKIAEQGEQYKWFQAKALENDWFLPEYQSIMQQHQMFGGDLDDDQILAQLNSAILQGAAQMQQANQPSPRQKQLREQGYVLDPHPNGGFIITSEPEPGKRKVEYVPPPPPPKPPETDEPTIGEIDLPELTAADKEARAWIKADEDAAIQAKIADPKTPRKEREQLERVWESGGYIVTNKDQNRILSLRDRILQEKRQAADRLQEEERYRKERLTPPRREVVQELGRQIGTATSAASGGVLRPMAGAAREAMAAPRPTPTPTAGPTPERMTLGGAATPTPQAPQPTQGPPVESLPPEAQRELAQLSEQYKALVASGRMAEAERVKQQAAERYAFWIAQAGR